MQAEFLRDVLAGLRAKDKHLPCKYFYDATGSRLFERITDLDVYYPTRTELAILDANATAIAARIGPGALVIEPGSGAGLKTQRLLEMLEEPAAYVPVDIDPEVLQRTRSALHDAFPQLPVLPVAADYTRAFELPLLPATTHVQRVLIFYPGSTIGNFEPNAAAAFLGQLAERLPRPLQLLIGIDRHKETCTLEAAYDDPQGVTAEFNRNILHHINRALGADFDPQAFEHVAFYDRKRMRIEMHLESLKPQTVRIGDYRIEFRRGERIHTESSYKYTLQDFDALARRAGFHNRHDWSDPEEQFSVLLYDAALPASPRPDTLF